MFRGAVEFAITPFYQLIRKRTVTVYSVRVRFGKGM